MPEGWRHKDRKGGRRGVYEEEPKQTLKIQLPSNFPGILEVSGVG